MASHNILSLTIFILFLIPANGRSFQKPQNVHLKAISRASYVTNDNDVLGLNALISQFPSLLSSDGDPCVDLAWVWIECNSDSRPRVIALNLYNVGLYGYLPDFSSMDALQKIDFSQNYIFGEIPSFLGTFPNLQELNLANNYFNGAVPASICNNKNLKLNILGNAYITTTCSNTSLSPPGSISDGSNGNVYQIPSTRTKKKSNTPKILGGVIPALVILGAVVGGFAIHHHKAKTAAAVAQASAMPAGPTDPNAGTPTEEVPMNVGPNHMGQQS